MTEDVPATIAIDHDEYSAKYIGRTDDGRQFILTTPFEAAVNDQSGTEFLALYVFDKAGKLLDAKIENLGPRVTLDEDRRVRLRDEWLKQLGDVTFDRVEVALFSVKRFGSEFGLIVREPEDEEDILMVEMQPGNYMAFYARVGSALADGDPVGCDGPPGRTLHTNSSASTCL